MRPRSNAPFVVASAVAAVVVVLSVATSSCDREEDRYDAFDDLPIAGGPSTVATNDDVPLDVGVRLFDCPTAEEWYGVALPSARASRIDAEAVCFETRPPFDPLRARPASSLVDTPLPAQIGVFYVPSGRDIDVLDSTIDEVLRAGSLVVIADPEGPGESALDASVVVHDRTLAVRRHADQTLVTWSERGVPFRAVRRAKPSVMLRELEDVLVPSDGGRQPG